MIFDWIKSKFQSKDENKVLNGEKVFSTENRPLKTNQERREALENALAKTFQKELPVAHVTDANGKSVAMDSASNLKFALPNYGGFNTTISDIQLSWYASQGFIGYQACAIISQHWMVDKACTMPAEDAIRNGYDITVNDGSEVDDDVIDEIREQDKKYKINDQLKEFVRNGKIFGIRIAIFKIKSNDPRYYEKPFNLDGITPGSYLGIAQVDPYWMAPDFNLESINDPSSISFYEPTYWMINGIKYHKSHLVIMKNGEVADILKPSYMYGGIPVPQKIYERIYAAERCANEAPQLLLTKRSVVLKTDLTQAVARQRDFEEKIAFTTQYMDNYGARVVGTKDVIEHLDTNLSDIDNIIMTQYQLVAAIANVPADKLIGTAPKGFNATGEYQQKNYHEHLESVQTNDMTPLLERHHQITIRSDVCPKFNIPVFQTSVSWTALNSVDAKEQAEINKLNGETDAGYIAAGVVDGEEVRKKLINNSDSGFNGLDSEEVPEQSNEEDPDEFKDLEQLEEPFKDG